ncbi:MAG: FHA domain-containing serine/threonine-protein kinase, partial [Deltaproteobacteria bacterium]
MTELARGALVAGRYETVRLLGQGAAKQVFLADDRLTGEQVALALLRPQGYADETVTARFMREGRIGSTLVSPYIVRVLDEGLLEDGSHYLVTEAVLGRSMEDALAHGAVAPELAARWTLQVLAALAEAHRLGIVHRDVKPDNVLLARTASGEIARLTDFGIAKLLDTSVETALTVETAANVMLGTPQYMSPEQWKSTSIDGRADLYATAVMLYELLLGCFPFEADSLEGLCYAHMGLPPRPFPSDLPAMTRALEPAVMRALAKEPEDRYASAEAMREAIEQSTGLHLHDGTEEPELVYASRFARAELLSDLWPSSIQLLMSPTVVIGRSDDAQLTVRCLPDTPTNATYTKMISSRHALIDWRGGQARITDLGSKSGTAVGNLRVGSEPVSLVHGDEIAIGPHARLRYEHALVALGELPRWARFTRLDPWGCGRQHVLVLIDAT